MPTSKLIRKVRPTRATDLTCLSVLVLVMGVSEPAGADFERTESRADCSHYDPLRQPFFGDLHVHTSFSQDAFVFEARNDPRAAYRFAKGEAAPVPNGRGVQDRRAQIDRPLDFVAVTDHAEFFADVNICATEGAPGYDSAPCAALRGDTPPYPPRGAPSPGPPIAPPWFSPRQLAQLQNDAAFRSGVRLDPPRSPVCGIRSPGDTTGVVPWDECQPYELSTWAEIQGAAEEAYDRSETCEFTSFVGYEYTASESVVTPFPGANNLHRNVIFRNERVPADPFSSLDAAGSSGPGYNASTSAAPLLYDALEDECLEGIEGCDVLTIPHNPNLSGGVMFEDPATAEDAARRAAFEPLVEVFQTKGGSECRTGVGTTDEDCGFELLSIPILNSRLFGGPHAPDAAFPERNFVRNVLKDGLALEQELGVNPFKYGMVGSTDNHSGTAGDTAEAGFIENSGNHSLLIADPVLLPVGRISATPVPGTNPPQTRANGAALNPGGLTVAWAEENSRDSLFEAMRRREVYATSGTRVTVRFFGGWKFADDDQGEYSLESKDIVESAYKTGVPMGADLPPAKKRTRKPSFIVMAAKDPGSHLGPGTDLQRIQIVKGWVDASGQTQEQVYEVAGDPDNGAGVDPATCTPVGSGFNELGTVWEDPDFDPDQPAFYYARVFENPTCRSTTLECLEFGVNPFADAATCAAQEAAVPGLAGGACCLNEDTRRPLQPLIQERAWTSPIWYTP